MQTGVAYTGPTGRPVLAVPDAGGWRNPGPDSKSRCSWNYCIGGGTVLIEGASKYGVLSVVVTGTGSAYYNHSSLTYDARACEFHLTDPADMGLAVAGSKNPWNVQPYSMTDVTTAMKTAVGNDPLAFVGSQNFVYGAGAPAGATYDETTKKLWVFLPGLGSGYKSALVCYSVNC